MNNENIDDAYYTAFVSSGSIIIECQCGITHIADDEFEYLEYYEQDEVIEFEKEHPDKVIHHDCTSISWGFVGDKQVVYDCPCGFDKKLQIFLVENQHQIINFYRRLFKLEKQQFIEKEKALSEV